MSNNQEKESNLSHLFRKNVDLDIIAVIRFLWTKRISIFKVALIFLLFGIFIAFGSRKEYKADAKLLPEPNGKEIGTSGLLGQFGNLSNLAGIDLGNIGGTDAVRPELYPEIIQSTPFLLKIMKEEVSVSDADSLVSIQYYLENMAYVSIIDYVKKYTFGLTGTNSFISEGSEKICDSDGKLCQYVDF